MPLTPCHLKTHVHATSGLERHQKFPYGHFAVGSGFQLEVGSAYQVMLSYKRSIITGQIENLWATDRNLERLFPARVCAVDGSVRLQKTVAVDWIRDGDESVGSFLQTLAEKVLSSRYRDREYMLR